MKRRIKHYANEEKLHIYNNTPLKSLPGFAVSLFRYSPRGGWAEGNTAFKSLPQYSSEYQTRYPFREFLFDIMFS